MSRIKTLDNLFNAQSIAVFGASNNPFKASHQIIKTMIREKYKGAIFPVNPHRKDVLGLSSFDWNQRPQSHRYA
jgi:acyl-CoA synthetase (NDP forming)